MKTLYEQLQEIMDRAIEEGLPEAAVWIKEQMPDNPQKDISEQEEVVQLLGQFSDDFMVEGIITTLGMEWNGKR